MNEFQRMVKNLAILFAVFLSVIIIGSIATSVLAVLGAVDVFQGGRSDKVIDFSQEYDANEINNIHVKGTNGNLTLQEGDVFKVEAKNVSSTFTSKMSPSGTLEIGGKSDSVNWMWLMRDNRKAEINITIPKDYTAAKITIDAGAGNIGLHNLVAERLIINCGAGNIDGQNIMADKVTVNGGVGNIDLNDIDFTDLYLDGGVGNVKMEGVLYGKTDIDCGVGECELTIQNEKEEYNLSLDPGVGAIYVNGDKYGEVKSTNPSAENSIKVDGGVGSVKLKFE